MNKLLGTVVTLLVSSMFIVSDDRTPDRGLPAGSNQSWVTTSKVIPFGDHDDMHAVATVRLSEPMVRVQDGVLIRVMNAHISFRLQQIVVSERVIATSFPLDDGHAIQFTHEKPSTELATYFASAFLDPETVFPQDLAEPETIEFTMSPNGTWGGVADERDLDISITDG